MYTEDDDEVKVKNKNSNNDYNDFYTAFNESEPKKVEKKDNKKEEKKNNKNDNKNNKKNSKKEEKTVLKDEEDYSDFYGISDEEDEEVSEPSFKEPRDYSKLIKIGIIALAVIIVILLVWLLLSHRPSDIEISNPNISLNAGEIEYISYKIVNTDEEVTSTFTSSNPSVATVDENGVVRAVARGETVITIKYTIGNKTREKKCTVKVNGPEVKHEISLELRASANGWTNKDVTVTVYPQTDGEITLLQYAINCDSKCKYKNVENKKIVINSNGITKVTVIAKDSNNQEITKDITVKIDKEKPKVTYNGSNKIVANNDVEVCVTCNDTISGCKQEKVCKKYTSSKTNQTIIVYDNAGNSVTSPSFNVTINRVKVTCSLKVSSDGTVSATLGSSAAYYGFSSSYSGNNELSKKIDISNVTKKGQKGAKLVHYYVKDKSGASGTCHITVVKECSADNNCTFRAN